MEELDKLGYIPPMAKPSDSYQEIYGQGVPNYQYPHMNTSLISTSNLNEGRMSRFDNDFEIIDVSFSNSSTNS